MERAAEQMGVHHAKMIKWYHLEQRQFIMGLLDIEVELVCDDTSHSRCLHHRQAASAPDVNAVFK